MLKTGLIDGLFLGREISEATRINNQLKTAIADNQAELSRLQAAAAAAATEIEQLHQVKAELSADLSRLQAHYAAEATRLSGEATARIKAHYSGELERIKAGFLAESKALKDNFERLKVETQLATGRLQAGHKAQWEAAAADHARKLEALAQSHSEAVAAIEADIEQRRGELGELEGRIKERLRLADIEEEQRVQVIRREFEVEQRDALLQLRAEQLEAAEALKSKKMAIIEEYRGLIEQPLLEEIATLTLELGKIRKRISKDHMGWKPGQIKEFFVREREGRREPTHVRIGGASESGKSHMLNQLVSGGLESLGVTEVEFVLLDPFGSDTKWDIPPTIYDDPEAAAAIVKEWAENAKGEKLPRPTILIIDEFDTLVNEHGLSDQVKAIVKLGRHRNRFLWAVGQNGNCPKGFQISDLRNLNQIYLGSVAVDYVENGMKGRNRNHWLGELEALREQSPYHAIVQPKDRNPYTVLIPALLFPGAIAAAADSPPPLTCPECKGSNLKKDGLYKYGETVKQRMRCKDCNHGFSVEKEDGEA